MPEVIEDGYKAIAVHCFNCGADITAETARKAISAWNRRAQPDHIGDANKMIAQPDNAPLTLEELRGMEGEPVYSQKEDLWVLITINEYGPVLVFKDGSRCFAADWLETDCGPLYRRKPEGASREEI